mgnify:CR=1 FL=1
MTCICPDAAKLPAFSKVASFSHIFQSRPPILTQMLQWRELLVEEGQQGAAGVSSLRQVLSSVDDRAAVADGIDAALETPAGLGGCLVDYAKVGCESMLPECS